METQYHITKDELVVSMPGEVDHHAAQTLSREIDFLIDTWQVKKLVFDFAGTEFMDSSGIGVMIGRKKTMELYRGEIHAIHLGERIRQIFEKSGLSRIIIIDEAEQRR